ncbi:MAG TPA: 3-deoxy-7-phosphoheptulonate synthase [Candidatus Saccharimonadales bacterium]|nr:3-deoxy-7-phosphoheptulonate synthase [Candidatus Saccharimonadales bacterium]
MNSATLEGITAQELLAPAKEVVELLPEPDYPVNYQPTWPNKQAVIDAVHELRNTGEATTPDRVDALSAHLFDIATGRSDKLLGVTGKCADRLLFNKKIHSLLELGRITLSKAAGVLLEREVVLEAGDYSFISRVLNFAKPRTNAKDKDKEGTEFDSWFGDSVNGKSFRERTPDASRMVSAALESRDVMAAMTDIAGEHVPVAHELLLLPYEIGMLRQDSESGRLYSLSADMLWIGARTNDPEGAHVNLAAMIANPVGVKLGPDTTTEQVAALAAKLNPDGIPGKLTFMIRMGVDNIDVMDSTLEAIQLYAPESIVLYDPHGSTIKQEGVKIRAVDCITSEIQVLARVCNANKMALHGVLLETTPDNNREECVEALGQMPRDMPDVDPLLNSRQLGRILRRVAPVLGRKAMGLVA